MTNEELQKIFDQMRAVSQKYPVEFDLAHSQIIGYKILRTCDTCERSSGKFILVSPQISETHWENGQLEAHIKPHQDTMNGIHFAKSPHYPGLMQYVWHTRRKFTHYMVKCVLSGTVIETEWGYRAQHAEIERMIEVSNDYGRMVIHGDWKSYQEVEYTETQRVRYMHSYSKEWEFTRTPWRDGNPFIGTDSGS